MSQIGIREIEISLKLLTIFTHDMQGKWYQAGIVSYGIGCGEDGIPSVYSDVSSAVCWIDQQVSDFYGDQSYYDFERSECP